MALNVVNEAGVYQAPAATPAAEGWSFTKMLADPNFQMLLANMGKAADPEGVGGIVGGAASNMISSKAAQGALEKSEAQRQTQIKQLIDTLGGVTPKDKPGVTSIKRTPSGGVAFDLDLPALDQPVGVATRSAISPTAAATPERTQLLTGEQPKAPVVPTAPQVATTPVPAQSPAATRPAVRDVADIFPFY